jgi:PAS domain S-box-containing protein
MSGESQYPPLKMAHALVVRADLLMVLTDRAGRIEWVNPAFADRVAIPPDELLKQKFFDVLAPHSTVNVQQAYIREQLLKGESFKFEIACTTFAQTKYWLLVDGQPMHGSEGIVIGYSILATDITLRKQTEQDLEQTRLRLQQANEVLEVRVQQRTEALYQEKERSEKAFQELQHAQTQLVQAEKMSSLGEMVAGILHEINNPLGCITGNLTPAKDYIQDLFRLLQLFQEKYPNPGTEIQEEIESIDLEFLQEDLPNLLTSIQESADRMQRISTSMRTFVRSDTLEKIKFDIHQGLDSTLLILQHRLKPKGDRPAIQIVKTYSKLPLLNCFPGQLNQVFMNLLVNAIDALEEFNSGRSYTEIQATPNCIHITTELAPDASAILVRIKDNGPGMSCEVMHKMFDYLFTTKSVGQGTGLGLSISRQIIEEKHGGKLACNSAPGAGTEFVIYLPL